MRCALARAAATLSRARAIACPTVHGIAGGIDTPTVGALGEATHAARRCRGGGTRVPGIACRARGRPRTVGIASDDDVSTALDIVRLALACAGIVATDIGAWGAGGRPASVDVAGKLRIAAASVVVRLAHASTAATKADIGACRSCGWPVAVDVANEQ